MDDTGLLSSFGVNSGVGSDCYVVSCVGQVQPLCSAKICAGRLSPCLGRALGGLCIWVKCLFGLSCQVHVALVLCLNALWWEFSCPSMALAWAVRLVMEAGHLGTQASLNNFWEKLAEVCGWILPLAGTSDWAPPLAGTQSYPNNPCYHHCDLCFTSLFPPDPRQSSLAYTFNVPHEEGPQW